jgi:tetratricopeptide (TPR) repeat protein
MKITLTVSTMLLSTLLLLGQEEHPGLVQQERDLYQKYQSQFEEIQAGANGDLKQNNQKLMKLAEKEPGTAMTMLVANMLYSVDPETSYALHKKAYAAEPTDKATILEWAMERHRKGEYDEAASLYQKYLKIVPQDLVRQALLADCLVRTGKLPEAVKAWKSANHANHHTGIDFAICEIYGPLSPFKRRSDLLDAIRGGDSKGFEKLIYLDINFDRDWWNSAVNKHALQADMDLAEKTLNKESQRFKDLLVYSKLATSEDSDDNSTGKALTDAGLVIGEKSRLPESSLIARYLVEKVIRCKLATGEELLKKYEKELSSRTKSNPGDPDALNLLCLLCVGGDKNKLAEYDKYGWEHFGDVKCAASYLVGLAANGRLAGSSAELAKALKQFPEDSFIRRLQIQTAGPDNVTTDMLAGAIKAEYRKLSPGMVIPDSYTLKGLFYGLNSQLEKK